MNKGRTSELNASGVTFRNFASSKQDFLRGGRLLYTFPLEVTDGDLVRKKSSLSGDTELSGLINEEFPESLSVGIIK